MARKIFDIIPLQGAGPFLLGMARSEAYTAMALIGCQLENTHGRLDYFCNSSVQIESDADGLIRFIGFSCEPGIEPRLYGKDIFSLTATELFQLISLHEPAPPYFNESECFFQVQKVSLWEADEQYDHRTNQTKKVWGQVGIAR